MPHPVQYFDEIASGAPVGFTARNKELNDVLKAEKRTPIAATFGRTSFRSVCRPIDVFLIPPCAVHAYLSANEVRSSLHVAVRPSSGS